MANLKHVGRIASNRRKVVVAFRVIPGDPEHCLVIATESLAADEHDALMKLVESAAGQAAYEFSEAMSRTRLPDGRNMLAGFNATGKLQKVKSTLVNMTPNTVTEINLAELNNIIAEQKGVTVAELAIKDGSGNTIMPKETVNEQPVDPAQLYLDESNASNNTQVAPSNNDVLTDDDLAAQYRSQADALFKEAKRLREQAEELSPTKKKRTTKSKETV